MPMPDYEPLETQWETLPISNDFIFAKLMRNKEICKELLEALLDLSIDHITFPEEQKAIDIHADAKSVRLDVYVKDDEDTVYNIEIQTANTDDLAKRSRYYQGMIDLDLIEKGEYYKKLNKSYVIFICTFDLFGRGRHFYTFQNTCQEDPAITLGDETVKLFVNTTGTQDDVSPEMKDLLHYIQTTSAEVATTSHNTLVHKMDQELSRIRQNKEWRREFMLLIHREQERYNQGKMEGLQMGRQSGLTEGLEKGKEDALHTFVLNMLKSNSPLDQIHQYTNLPLSEIMAIAKKNNLPL